MKLCELLDEHFCPIKLKFLHLDLDVGTITVFINGIRSEVPRGPFDLKAMFGQDVVLVNSSGELVPANEYGYLLQGLQMGESYFLVCLTKFSVKEHSSKLIIVYLINDENDRLNSSSGLVYGYK